MTNNNIDKNNLKEQIIKESIIIDKMFDEVSKVIVGQKEMIQSIILGLLTGGHILLEGVPGLAKTLSISSVSNAISLNFQRIQFTPDLLPTDLIGTMIFNPKTGEFYPKKGPVFTNIVLADEINRAPAKVQSALLEAMAEKQVTIGETSYKLAKPFLVLATQNPLEQEGTYPLPEAQMDRFMFKIIIDYPTKEEELEIINRMSFSEMPEISPIITKEQLELAANLIDNIYVDEKIKKYVVDIVMATRNPKDFALKKIADLIAVGSSPRASISLIKAAKAYSFIQKRDYVISDDIRKIAFNVLRHRIILNYEAEAENIKSDYIIKEILNTIEI